MIESFQENADLARQVVRWTTCPAWRGWTARTAARPAQRQSAVLLAVGAIKTLVLFCVLLLSPVSATAAETNESPPVDVDFTTIDEKQRSLSSYFGNGRWTLVMIWSVDCGICVRETPTISDFHDQHKDKDIHVVGLSLDGVADKDQVVAFAEKYQMRFPTLMGDVLTVASVFQNLTQEGFRGTPTFLLFDPDGEIRGVNPGPLRPEAVTAFVANHAAKH